MWYRLNLMMSKWIVSFMVMACMMVLSSCGEKQSPSANCNINGVVEISYNGGLSGFEITLEALDDNSIRYMAITDTYGNFSFQDIEAGKYIIDAKKTGYKWSLMLDDGRPNPYNKVIELEFGKTKDVVIQMAGGTSSFYSSLDITDVYGVPIGNSIHVPKYATTISFQLYNGTGEEHYWDIDYKTCFVSDDRGVYFAYMFDSFNQTSGILAPGENTIVIGTINQDIFNIYETYPAVVMNTICVNYRRYITIDIDF